MKNFFALCFLFSLTCGLSGQENQNTLLWKIEKKGFKPSYILGTMHLLPTDSMPELLKNDQIIEQVDKIFFEIDLESSAADMMRLMPLMLLPDSVSLEDHLSEKEMQLMMEKLGKDNPMSAMASKLKPIFIHSMLLQSSDIADDRDMTMVEQYLYEKASNYEKETGGLESAAFQMQILAGLDFDKQITYLKEALTEEEVVDLGAFDLEQMFSAYYHMNLTSIAEMLNSEELIQSEMDQLVNQRNKNWVEPIIAASREQSILVAVGAGHLPGEKGVLALLRNSGFEVQPIFTFEQ